MTARLQRLREVAILKPLPESAIAALEPRLDWRTVVAGEDVVSHLSPDADVYFIVEGAFGVSLTSPDGRQVSFRILQKGSHFGEIAALTGLPRSASVCAETIGLIARCPSAVFLEMMMAHPAFATAIASDLARLALKLTDRVFEKTALKARFRIYAELLRLANGVETLEGGLVIDNPPTHEKIAASVGAQREVVTRQLRYLSGEGILKKMRRRILILRPDRLRAMVEQHGGAISPALDARSDHETFGNARASRIPLTPTIKPRDPTTEPSAAGKTPDSRTVQLARGRGVKTSAQSPRRRHKQE